MTPDQRILAIWGGSLAAVVLTGWIVLGMRGETCANLQTAADSLAKKYSDLYPDQGISVIEAKTKWKVLLGHQESALKDAEASIVPDLPKTYQDTDLSSAAARVHADLQYLKQKAERQKIKLPATLPFEEGLDADAKLRGLQLASLYLYRSAVDACMDAGVTGITAVKAGKGLCDPSEKYALMLCDVDVEVSFEKAEQLLLDLLQKQNTKGFGIRALALEHDKSGNEHLTMTLSLLTVNDPGWGLKSEQGGGVQPAGRSGSSRFGKLGGG